MAQWWVLATVRNDGDAIVRYVCRDVVTDADGTLAWGGEAQALDKAQVIARMLAGDHFWTSRPAGHRVHG